jgi:dephospho-CoA kinase
MLNNVNLIGLSGQKRTGKDTLADYLCSNHGFTKYSFAGPLKKACQEIFMLTYEQTEGNNKEIMDNRWGVSARTIFQKVGTELFREKLSQVMPEMKSIEDNFWIYRFELWYEDFKKKNPEAKVIVSDARFPNEAKKINDLGGKMIKISRDTGLNTDNHASEKNVDLIKTDIIIENNNNIEEYYKKINKLFIKIN